MQVVMVGVITLVVILEPLVVVVMGAMAVVVVATTWMLYNISSKLVQNPKISCDLVYTLRNGSTFFLFASDPNHHSTNLKLKRSRTTTMTPTTSPYQHSTIAP
jgi:hypothetical protein